MSEYHVASEGGASHGYTELSSEDQSAVTSANPSRTTSPSGNAPPVGRRGRVRFNSTSEANDATNHKSKFPLRDRSLSPVTPSEPKQVRISPAHSRNSSITNLQRRTLEPEKENPFEDSSTPAVHRPKPSVLKHSSFNSQSDEVVDENEKMFSALAAQERAQRIATLVGSRSAPSSARTSFEGDEAEIPLSLMRPGGYPVRIDDLPLGEMDSHRTYDGIDDIEEEDFSEKATQPKFSSTAEAHKLVRAHTRKDRREALAGPSTSAPGLISGHVTPTEEKHDDYVPRPEQYRGGVLSNLLKLYNPPPGTHSRGESEDTTQSPSQPGTGASSGTTTPRKSAKWYNHRSQSQDTLAGLIEASAILGAQGGMQTPKKGGPSRPLTGKRTHSGKLIDSAMSKFSKPRLEDEIKITIHIAETLSRQKYLLKLCRALMTYGAPTHRLEEYMKMSSRVLEIDGQFLYIPGCMIVSFDDIATHTTEVKMVRAAQGVDLGKMKDVHEIYKEVVHDVIGVEEATQRLDEIIRKKQMHNPWLLVFVYGCASATVGPFAFQARLIDLPIAFLLGSILGILQLIVAPRSDLYSNVFEISAAVITSFLARAFGSINNGNLFCFSALAQSAIALILPGYLVLCASLELQSKSMVPGSVRMVYAIIYSLFLGFGITIGTVMYGLIDSNATSATTCSNPITGFYKWPFVPLFTLCLCIINQAKWKQIPVMLFISFAGYIVNYFSALKFPSSPQISNTFGALAVGVLGNFYSRLRHGLAAAALLPAIFVQVPSGLAASGSLLAGISSADIITNTTTYANGTAKINGTNSVSLTSGGDLNTVVFNVGYSMIEVAIGITVGLFISSLIAYPMGKKRSGLFSF